MRSARSLLALFLALGLAPGGLGGVARPERAGPEPDGERTPGIELAARFTTAAYYRPIVVDGMTFPVARANWLSVIELANDWHDPRMRFVDGRWQLIGFHEGVDILAEEGTPVLSASPGTVERVGWTFYSGTRVGVRGTDGRYYFYAHLSSIAPGIDEGERVQAGAVLGLVGNTGYGPPGHEDEFPPHLHFGIQDGAEWVNPYPAVRLLYRRAAAATARAERRLSRLEGNAFERLAARVYADL